MSPCLCCHPAVVKSEAPDALLHPDKSSGMPDEADLDEDVVDRPLEHPTVESEPPSVDLNEQSPTTPRPRNLLRLLTAASAYGETAPTTSPTTAPEVASSSSSEMVPTTSSEVVPTTSPEVAPTTSSEMVPTTSTCETNGIGGSSPPAAKKKSKGPRRRRLDLGAGLPGSETRIRRSRPVLSRRRSVPAAGLYGGDPPGMVVDAKVAGSKSRKAADRARVPRPLGRPRKTAERKPRTPSRTVLADPVADAVADPKSPTRCVKVSAATAVLDGVPSLRLLSNGLGSVGCQPGQLLIDGRLLQDDKLFTFAKGTDLWIEKTIPSDDPGFNDLIEVSVDGLDELAGAFKEEQQASTVTVDIDEADLEADIEEAFEDDMIEEFVEEDDGVVDASGSRSTITTTSTTLPAGTSRPAMPGLLDLNGDAAVPASPATTATTAFSVRTYRCGTCGMAFIGIHGLQRHTREHHGQSEEASRQCDRCGRVLSGVKRLRSHLLSMHGEDVPLRTLRLQGKAGEADEDVPLKGLRLQGKAGKAGEAGEVEVFACPVCGKRLSSRHRVQTHMRQHIPQLQGVPKGVPMSS